MLRLFSHQQIDVRCTIAGYTSHLYQEAPAGTTEGPLTCKPQGKNEEYIVEYTCRYLPCHKCSEGTERKCKQNGAGESLSPVVNFR